MIVAIAIGVIGVFLATLWVTAQVAAAYSPWRGVLAGACGYLVMMGTYLAALTLWARSPYNAFLNTELPPLIGGCG